jgi:hypothetical protein
VLSVAQHRKNTIVDFGRDAFTESCAAGRTGNGTPGLTGFGLTRSKPRVFADGQLFSVGSKADPPLPPPPHGSVTMAADEGSSGSRPVSSSSLGNTRLAPLLNKNNTNNPSVIESMPGSSSSLASPGNTTEDTISLSMMKILGNFGKTSKKKEEDHWKDVFRACLPEGAPDPYVDVEEEDDDEGEGQQHGAAAGPATTAGDPAAAGTAVEGGGRGGASQEVETEEHRRRESHRISAAHASSGRRTSEVAHRRAQEEAKEALLASKEAKKAKAAAVVASRQMVSARHLVKVLVGCVPEPEGGHMEMATVGAAVTRSPAMRCLRECAVLQEALLELPLPKQWYEEEEEGQEGKGGAGGGCAEGQGGGKGGGEEGRQQQQQQKSQGQQGPVMLGRSDWITFCESLQDLAQWNESVLWP